MPTIRRHILPALLILLAALLTACTPATKYPIRAIDSRAAQLTVDITSASLEGNYLILTATIDNAGSRGVIVRVEATALDDKSTGAASFTESDTILPHTTRTQTFRIALAGEGVLLKHKTLPSFRTITLEAAAATYDPAYPFFFTQDTIAESPIITIKRP